MSTDAVGAPTPVRLLRLREVLARVGLCRSAVYAGVKAKTFPAPIALAERKRRAPPVGWIEAEVTAWIEQRIAAARGTVTHLQHRVIDHGRS